MKSNVFEGQVKISRERVKALNRQAAALPADQKRLFMEALGELSTTLDELHAAGEDLTRQTEDLAVALKTAEAERERYQELFHYAPDGYLVTDKKGTILEANEAIEDLLAARGASLMGKPFVIFMAKRDHKPYLLQLRRLTGTERIEDWELNLKPRKGKSFPSSLTVTAMRDPSGKLIGFRWLVRDITEKKRQEQMAELASFPELNPNPVIEVDPSGQVHYINPAAGRLFPGLPEAGLIHVWLSGIGKAAKSLGKSKKKSFTRELKIGQKWFEQFVFSVMGGSRLRIYGHDITKRKQMEEALRKAHDELETLVQERTAELKKTFEALGAERHRFNDVLDVLPAYVVLLTPDYHVPFANRYFRERFGESGGRRCFEYLFGRSEPCEVCETYRVLETRARHEWEWTGPDGRNYHVTDFPFVDADGSTLILEMGVDITERKRAEETIRLQADQYNTILATSRDGFWLFDVEGRLLDVNEAYCEMSGYSRRELLQLHIADIEAIEKPEDIARHIRAVKETGYDRFETQHRRKDGKILDVEISVSFWQERSQFLLFVRNITERKRGQAELEKYRYHLEEVVKQRTSQLEDANEHLRREVAERQQAVAALRETRDYLDNLFNYANAPIIVWDTQFRITRFNHAFEHLTGRKAQEVFGKEIDMLFPEDSREEALGRILSVTAEGERLEVIEIPILHTDGSVRTVLWNSANVLASDGVEVVATIAQGQDITARKQMEESLANERANLQGIFDAANVGLLLIDQAGAVKRVNDVVGRWVGKERWEGGQAQPGDLVGCIHALEYPGACGYTRYCSACPIRNTFESVLRSGQPIHDVEAEAKVLIGGSETGLWLEVSADPLIIEGERHVILALNNITKRKLAEDALRETRDYLDNLFNYANAPIIVWDPQFRITRFNHAFERLTGRKAEEVLGGKIDILFPRYSHEESLAHIRKTTAEGERWEVIEIPILHADGSVKTVLWNSANVLASDEKTVVATIAQGQDITERKQKEEELRKVNRILEALSKSNQALTRAKNESDYMEEVCRIIVEDCGHAMAWIGFAEEDEKKTVRPVAHAGFEEGYLDTLNITWADQKQGRGPTGTAIRTGKTVICKNILIDPKFKPWREEAIKRGYASSIALPLMAQGKAFGAIMIYSGQPDPFSGHEVDLLTELADDLAQGITSLKLRAAQSKAEEALRQSEERAREQAARLQAVLDVAPIMIWSAYDRESRNISGNQASHDFLRVPPGTNISKTGPAPERLVHYRLFKDGAELSPYELPVQRTAASGQELRDYGMDFHFDDGTVRSVLGNVAPVFDALGEPSGAVAAFMDITDRKLMEEELRESRDELEVRVRERTAELAKANELLERVFSSIDLSVVYMDRDFNIIRVNRAYAEFDERTPEFYLGKNHFALFPDVENEAIFRKVVETGESYFAYEKPQVYAEHPERGVTYWDWMVQPVKELDGRTGGVVLSLVNVTRRKIAEQERLRLATAVEQSSEAVIITDAYSSIVYANRAFENLHALTRQEILGRQYGSLLRLDLEEEPFRRKIDETLSRGEAWKGRLTRRMSDGSERKLEVTISPVRDPSGQIINYAGLERDVTQEHKLQEHIRQMQKMEAIGTLAGGIAHDFNNILVPILLNTEMALADADEESSISHYLNLVLEAANRGKDLVKQIITFSRQKEQKREPIDIGLVVREALKFLRSSIPTTIEIRDHCDLELAIVRADPIQIHQVLMNLGSNAAYAMREKGGMLEVSLAETAADEDMAGQNEDLKPGSYLRLSVRDTGCGMTSEVMERAFDPFFTTKKPGEGSGMGLAVVHGIIKSHGGAITVSTEVGQGTTFDIYLPRLMGGIEEKSKPSKEIPTGKEKILLIDDEEFLIQSMKPMLERLGYRVSACTHALEALEMFRSQPEAFDLVITDQTMPLMTGEKLAQELMRIRPDIPIILSTGFSELFQEEEAKAKGIREFIMKPFSMSEIAQKIHAALKRT